MNYKIIIFLERVSSLNDDSTLYDVLYLVASNYNYLNLLMKKNNIESKNEYNDLCEFVFILILIFFLIF